MKQPLSCISIVANTSLLVSPGFKPSPKEALTTVPLFPLPTTDSPSISAASLAPGPNDKPDAIVAYVAMRDDINPRPRLQLIEEWARHDDGGEGLELLTQTMIDPDGAVPERARTRFDRAIAMH